MLVPEDVLKDRIERFIQHFRTELDQIAAITGKSGRTFRKLLYLSVLDALSICISEPSDTNGKRFAAFVSDFSDWPDGERVSLTHLVELLDRDSNPAFDKVREKAREMLSHWMPMRSREVFINKDPLPSSFGADWPRENGQPRKIENVRLEQLTHYSLLWAHRNYLAHELRNPGYGVDSGHLDSPFYHELETISYGDGGKQSTLTTELVYPDVFLLRLCRDALTNLCRHLIQSKLDPYEGKGYKFGSYWIRELNS